MNSRKIAGALSFIGAAQFFVMLLICEARYPGYSIRDNMISDLGIGATGAMFNSSIALLGLMIILSAISFNSSHRNLLFTALLCITGAGAIGVGLYPEDMSPYHEIFAGMTFVFGGVTQIFSAKLLRYPMSIVVVALGCITLISLILFVLKSFMDLGPGGMERMIVYPVLLWGAGFGGYLMASERR